MRKSDRVVAWILLHCFFVAQIPLFAQGGVSLVPQAPAETSALHAPDAAPSSAHVSRLVGPQDAVVMDMDGVRLEMPAGALKKPALIAISKLPAAAQLDEGMRNATLGVQGYRFEPHGIVFQKPVRITMSFDPGIAESPTALSNLYTYFYDQMAGRWERLEKVSVDRKAATITSLSRHFTDMINATLKLPEGPQPIQYDVNSIKNLEAANPGEGVVMPDGPQPGSFGSASFRLPLRLPPGRGGANPRLALRYSSDGAETWLGKGFDIEVPAITIDTRFGLPHYDGADRYSLDGEELLPIGTDRDGSLLFQPRTEKSFARIRWYRAGGAGGEDDYWQVTEKNGTVREYGHSQTEGWLGPQRSDRTRTYSWYLSKVKDSFGNVISYAYTNDQNISTPGTTPNNYAYLSDIYYTGVESTGDRGAFHVAFVLESKDREDRRLDSRGTFLSKLARRLQTINLYYKDAIVRSYQFAYKYNEFGQSLLSGYSEVGGPGSSTFYSYSFDYYALPKRLDQGNPVGYDAFGTAEELWTASADGLLQSSKSSSVGGNLYLGLDLFIPIPFFGKIEIANFGLRGGVNSSSSGSLSTILDLNGDGLPDLAWNQGGSIAAYLNTPRGLDALASAFGTPGTMDREDQLSFSLGLSAGLLGTSYALTRQNSYSETQTAFVDVNADGLPDFVTAGSDFYGGNTGTGFDPTPWGSGTESSAGSSSSGSEDADYQKTYFQEQPLRAWKAYRSGTIAVTQSAHLINPGSVSDDGLQLDTYAENTTTPAATISLTRANASSPTTRSTLAIGSGQKLFFLEDTRPHELGDEVSWNVGIKYTSINLFEDMKYCGVFSPPALLSSLPDQALLLIYQYNSGSRNGSDYYSRIPGWEGKDPSQLGPVYRALFRNGFFTAQRVPKTLFLAMLSAASKDTLAGTFSTSYKDATGAVKVVEVTRPTADTLLQYGFSYEPESQTFIRAGSRAGQVFTDSNVFSPASYSSDSLFGKYFLAALQSLGANADDYSSMGFWKAPGGGYVFPQSGGGGAATWRSTVHDSLPATVSAPAAQGNILLEQTYDPAGAQFEQLWLKADSQGNPNLARVTESGENVDTTANPRITGGADSQTITLSDRGITRDFAFSARSSYIQSLTASLYQGAVSNYILSAENLSGVGYSLIQRQAWNSVTAGLTSAQLASFNNCFARDANGDYALVPQDGASDPGTYAADLQTALLLIDGASRQSKSIFDVLPGDAAKRQRFILLNLAEMNSFMAACPAGVSSYFLSFSDAKGNQFFYQHADLNADEQNKLLEAIRAFRRDVELFPYYECDSGSGDWSLKPLYAGLADSNADYRKIAATMSACSVWAWTALDRTIMYSSDQRLPAQDGTLPSGSVEEAFIPQGSTGPGDGSSIVFVPYFAQDGKTIVAPRYIHSFDSNADYTSGKLDRLSDVPNSHGAKQADPWGDRDPERRHVWLVLWTVDRLLWMERCTVGRGPPGHERPSDTATVFSCDDAKHS